MERRFGQYRVFASCWTNAKFKELFPPSQEQILEFIKLIKGYSLLLLSIIKHYC